MKNRIIYLFSILLILSNFVHAQELPKLKSGVNLRDFFWEKGGYRWDNGFTIHEFRINKQGKVDSVIVTNKYYNREYKDLVLAKTETLKDLIKSFEFEPLDKSVWVQCKVYVNFITDKNNNLHKDDELYNFNISKYGLDLLWESEIKAYFTDFESKTKEYIISNEKVILAPIYLNIIT